MPFIDTKPSSKQTKKAKLLVDLNKLDIKECENNPVDKDVFGLHVIERAFFFNLLNLGCD